MRLYCKLAGILLVLISAVMTGLELEHGLKLRWLYLREMSESLRFLEKEMIYHRTPVSEALSEAAKRCQTELKTLFLSASKQTESKKERTFDEIWAHSVRETAAGILTKQEIETVCELSGALCNTDTVMQKTLLEKYQERFAVMSRDMEQQFREKGALYHKLSAAAGAFLALLLL